VCVYVCVCVCVCVSLIDTSHGRTDALYWLK
jgi:hypothetical protein